MPRRSVTAAYETTRRTKKPAGAGQIIGRRVDWRTGSRMTRGQVALSHRRSRTLVSADILRRRSRAQAEAMEPRGCGGCKRGQMCAALLRLGVTVAVAFVVAACSTDRQITTPSASGAPCVTTATHMVPPQEAMDFFVAGTSPRPTFASREEWARGGTWYGDDRIWLGLPEGGAIRANQLPFSLKIPSWQTAAGPVAITGRRLDGPGSATGTVPEPIHGSGFQPSSVVFPTPGCWEVTYSVDSQPLRFIVRIDPP